jgi:4-hydroxy 2-oxovalerate aldolase
MIPEILDVTLRDGGYVNDFAFPTSDAVKIVSSLPEAGVRKLEVGYFRPSLAGDPSVPGPKCCRASYLSAVTRAARDAEVFVMVHPGEVEIESYSALADQGVDGVRLIIATTVTPTLERHARAIRAAGLTCSANLIRISQRSPESIVSHGRAAAQMGADWLYLADSNGSMFPDGVEGLFRDLKRELRIPLGFHAHDPLRLAFANALAAVRGGATLLDSSLGGMGKGAGNLATEIITAYLKAFQKVPYRVAEIVSLGLEVVSRWIARDHEKKCESALSAFLDLNMDELKVMASSSAEQRCSLLAALDRAIDERLQSGPGPVLALEGVAGR